MPIWRWAVAILGRLGIDPAVAFILIGHIWNGLFSILQLVLILGKLTPAEQGVNFNFTYIFMIQGAFDLGFIAVGQQMASHQIPFLTPQPDGSYTGDPAAMSRLASLWRITLRWYALIASVWILIMLPLGWLFFRNVSGLTDVVWQPGWVVLVPMTAACLIANGVGFFLSGSGYVLGQARSTTLQIMLGAMAFCAIMALGGKLLSFPGSTVIGIVPMGLWILIVHGRRLRWLMKHQPGPQRFTWRHDVWPFQWRLACSWLGTQLVFFAMNPIASLSFGSEAAGKLGITMVVFMTVQIVGQAWINTRAPTFGNLIALRKWPDLNREYRRVVMLSTGLMAAFNGLLSLINFGLNQFSYPLIRDTMDRVLEPLPTLLLGLATVANHLVYSRTVYLRAHCREPYYGMFLVQGIAILIAFGVAGRFGTLTQMLAAYLALVVAIGLGWGTWIFRTKQIEWHD